MELLLQAATAETMRQGCDRFAAIAEGFALAKTATVNPIARRRGSFLAHKKPTIFA
jgi:hypothetical protein